MKRLAACLVILGCLGGCKDIPKPSCNLLAPYGSSRVAPPATNSVGAGSSYYNRMATPTVTVPTIRRDGASAGASTTTGAAAAKLATGNWKRMGGPSTSNTGPVGTGVTPAHDEQVSPASYTSSDPQRYGESTTTSSLLQLTGLPLNDATNLPEPPRFQPARGTRPLGTVAGPAATGNIGVATSQASDHVVSRAQNDGEPSTGATLNWRDRYDIP